MKVWHEVELKTLAALDFGGECVVAPGSNAVREVWLRVVGAHGPSIFDVIAVGPKKLRVPVSQIGYDEWVRSRRRMTLVFGPIVLLLLGLLVFLRLSGLPRSVFYGGLGLIIPLCLLAPRQQRLSFRVIRDAPRFVRLRRIFAGSSDRSQARLVTTWRLQFNDPNRAARFAERNAEQLLLPYGSNTARSPHPPLSDREPTPRPEGD